MLLVPIEYHEDDDAALLFRLRHILAGAARYVRPQYIHIVKVDSWFGLRWRFFVGNRNGEDFHSENRLATPPFAPNRVVSEKGYARVGDELAPMRVAKIHMRPFSSSARTRYLDEVHSTGMYVWYSGNTAKQDRASLMVYEVEKGVDQRAWYVEFQLRNGVWAVSNTAGTSANELQNLETAYGGRLLPLYRKKDEQGGDDRRLWEMTLDAVFESRIAQATVLVEKYKKRHPSDVYILLLNAKLLGMRRAYVEAEEVLLSIEHYKSTNSWRVSWLREWGSFCELRNDEASREETYRELTSLNPNDTHGWIMLGSSLAWQGKLEEAEAVHRQATKVEGDRDEAYLNLGLVLRAQGRFQDAESAFQDALKLCPQYPEASEALEDVRVAIRMLDEMD